MEHLGRMMSQDSKYIVRIFEGPDMLSRRGSTTGQMGDATVDYLNVISAWHRISDDIVQFVSSDLPVSESKDSSRTGTPQSDTARSTERSLSPSATNENAIPVALVPRYQLTTADAFACTIPIKDRYALLDHWQWMASLWRACVGPDVTIHIRECDRDEMERHGSGNPVEMRLTEARTLIVRRLTDSSKDLEGKLFDVSDLSWKNFLRGSVYVVIFHVLL
jgi:HMG box factor